MKYKNYVEELRIIDFYLSAEWSFDISKLVIAELPYLCHLLVNSNSSSGWLKYVTANDLLKLTLYHCVNHHETQLLLKKPEMPVVVIRPNHPRFFNMNHVCNFKNLTHLTLHEYTFNWDPEESSQVQNLRSLALIDCRWDYPFNLTQFNTHNKLQNLEVRYSRGNPFILSERLNMFLLDETSEIFTSLKLLTIAFYKHTSMTAPSDCAWEKYLNHRIINKFLNEHNYPNLKKLHLHGWYLSISNLKKLVGQISYNNLSLMEISLISNYTAGLEEVKEECARRFPHMRTRLSVMRDHSVYAL